MASVIESLGEAGVGLLVALENLIPPIPSEIVLSMAGYLASEGRVNLVLVYVAATAGSVLRRAGALLARATRSARSGCAAGWTGSRWSTPTTWTRPTAGSSSTRRRAVLFGRMAPVVRSLVSIPAGANHMPLGQFTLLTTIGSGVWNALFVGGGYALGSRWQDVEKYSHWFDYAIWAFFVVAIGSWVVKKVRKRRRAAADR